jgi:hypothetical protein
MTFVGPLQLPRATRQRIRFDLTQDEAVIEPAELRGVFHGYSDAPEPTPRVRCYTLSEIVAEKVRALVERAGRARDVYDVVNVGRNLRAELASPRIADLAARKFAFKDLPKPVPDAVLARVDPAVLEVDWNQALRHQLPVLPPVGEALASLSETVRWLLGGPAPAPPPVVPGRAGEHTVEPVRFARPVLARQLGLGAPVALPAWQSEAYGSGMDRVRYAARNRLLIQVRYHGVQRLVEPYSLRRPRTGNLLLYVYEVGRGAGPGEGVKAFKVAEIDSVALTDQPFTPRYLVEL